jgi:phosphate transport system permease protein
MLDRVFTFACAAGIVAAFTIFAFVIAPVVLRGARAVSWTFLTQHMTEAGAGGGIVYQLLGTLILIATAATCVLPLAIGLGITHQLYVSPRKARAIGSTLHALNAVPSIVFGLFGLAVFVQSFGLRKSWLAGGLVLAMMILPTVSLAFIEKLRAVPRATLEAATGLGLRRAQIAWGILLPQGVSGLVTGTLLGLARAAGETAPIMFTAAVFSGATVPRGVVDSPVLALPYHIFVLAQDSLDPASTGKMWGSAVVLLSLVLLLSAIALPFRLKVHEEARRV